MVWISEDLFPLTYNISPKYDKQTLKNIKSYCRNEPKTHCVLCGGMYKKPSYCHTVDDTYYPSCQLCNIITSYKPSYSKYVSVWSSIMTQLDIVRQTVEFITKNKSLPTITNIDPNARQTNMKPIQFIKLFNEHDDKVKNYKLFYTGDVNIEHIILHFIADERNTTNLQQFTTTQRIDYWNKRFLETLIT